MNEIEIAYLFSQAEKQKEGLPVWIFYIALCVILLLLFLAFLHNKRLRKKINDTFLVYKKKFLKFWLTAIRRQEEKKRSKLLIQLGQHGLEFWPQLKEVKEVTAEIKSLEEKKQNLKESGQAENSTQLNGHYQAIGLIIDRTRPEIEQLSIYHSKLDTVERRIKILERELENL